MTGATGHMGIEALKLFASDGTFRLKLLVQGNRHDKKILKEYRTNKNIEIIEGDLRNFNDLRKGVTGANFVIHLGAIIPPAADKNPEATQKINLGGTLNIIRAVKEQPHPENIRLVYVASVALFGNRPAPIHWARTGDPVRVSCFDSYAVSKVKAERAVIESGLRYWVSLRQSGMLHRDYLKLIDPIIFHQPLDNHIEWSTAEDSGRVLYNICSMELSDDFWRNMYNIGNGAEFRVIYHDFLMRMFGIMGIRDIHRVLSPRDFAARNFHCVWYSDSDILERLLHFRKSTYEGFLRSLKIPIYCRLVKYIPMRILKKLVFEPLSRGLDGTRNWINNNISDRISAYWGSRDSWEKIPESWNDFRICRVPASAPLEHGWDENKATEEIGLADCMQAALFRGGECLSTYMKQGDLFTPLEWRCAVGHRFHAAPNTVLRGGHWCPVCDTDVSGYEVQAEHSPFFAQVYNPGI